MEAKFLNAVPRLPTDNIESTKIFYETLLGFKVAFEFGDYLILRKENVELHFFLHSELKLTENEGMCYIRVSGIHVLYAEYHSRIPPKNISALETKPWGQREFSVRDSSQNLLTFGEGVDLER